MKNFLDERIFELAKLSKSYEFPKCRTVFISNQLFAIKAMHDLIKEIEDIFINEWSGDFPIPENGKEAINNLKIIFNNVFLEIS